MAGFAVFGCGKIATPPSFNGARLVGAAAGTYVSAYQWAEPTTIDAGAFDVNNDPSPSCLAKLTDPNAIDAGCMQNPAMVYSDGRWIIGFSQDFFPSAGEIHYGLLASMTSLLTRAFGALGTGVGLIDAGRAADSAFNGNGVSTSSRYVRYAKFPNGDVIAVYTVELPNATAVDGVALATVNTVYATIYNATTNTWGSARQLGTYAAGSGRQVELGLDYGTGATRWGTHECKPAVATSGDNSAMVTWCEYNGTTSEIVYARYKNGAWVNAVGTPTTLVSTVNTYVNPGFRGLHHDWSNLGSAVGATISNTIRVGDSFYQQYYNGKQNTCKDGSGTGYEMYFAYATAVSSSPGLNQFAIVTNPDGAVQVCSTFRNIIQTLQATTLTYMPYYGCTAGAAGGDETSTTTLTLSNLGVSLVLNPSCTEPTTANWGATTWATWTASTYINRSLSSSFNWNGAATAASQHTPFLNITLGAVNQPRLDSTYSMYLYRGGVLTQPNAKTALAQTSAESWERSAVTDIAGDGFGNYALVRSAVAPFFHENDITANGLSRSRRLVGHEFIAASDTWKQRQNAAAGQREPEMTYVSNPGVCKIGGSTTSFQACSVRNPKILMSDSGKGLFLFYQTQPENPTAGAVANPTRLWWGTYTVGSGFSTTAHVLDTDTTCSGSSLTTNDTSVCEAADFQDPTTWDYRCQNLAEPSSRISIALASMLPVTNDPQPIAAHMTRSGLGAVVYHKKYNTSDATSPVCDKVGTFLATYDTVNGFGDVVQLDDQLGDTMHANVYVADSGNIAVVWEQISGDDPTTSEKYVYLKMRIDGTWTSNVIVNTDQYDSEHPMMPAVGINDESELVVTYSYGAPLATRRQYVRHFYKF